MFETSVTIAWGDCDETGIVFYPNYFRWLDHTFQQLLRSRGLGLREIRQRFGAVAPIVQAHSDFRAPARYDDVLDIAVAAQAEGERRIRVDYRLSVNGKPIATGHEVRAWATVGDDGSLKGAPVSPEFLSALGMTG
ncbi:MAG: acyl-CoA thioesterase [Xanthobacteraceae bacterium]|jgi:acyl-CoA thioester hydrolase